MGIPRGVGKLRRMEEAEVRDIRAKAEARLPERSCPLSEHVKAEPSDATEIGTSVVDGQSLGSETLRDCEERMIRNGWCAHQVRHLSRTHDIGTFSFLSRRGQSSLRQVDHTRCIQYRSCVAYNVREGPYASCHVETYCPCPMATTPGHDLVKVIRQGHIPLISMEGVDSTGSTCELRVKPRTSRSIYVAVSHVWSDGLGNPDGNALPLCQIKRLKAHLAALEDALGKKRGTFLLWMDTLCIPVASQEHALRLLQIDMMASIYKGAIASLVLDLELMASSIEERQVRKLNVALRASIACSVWMSRSWTLQEGWLPSAVAIQFQNGVVVLKRTSESDGRFEELVWIDRPTANQRQCEIETVQTPEAEPDQGLEASERLTQQDADQECECVEISLQRNLYSTLFNGKIVSESSKDESTSSDAATHFIHVWNELAGRSTSKFDDIVFIMANILDLDTRGLLQYSRVEDMLQAIILSLRRVPLSLFFNHGPKQDPDGNHQNRWIPESVSTDMLTARVWFEITPSHLSRQYKHESEADCFIVYTFQGMLPSRSSKFLCCEHEGVLSCAKNSENETVDELNFEGFTSTCFLIENVSGLDIRNTRSGACFYAREYSENVPERGSFAARRMLRALGRETTASTQNIRDMTFLQPIELQLVERSEFLDKTEHHLTFNLSLLESQCELKIRYDSLPDFTPLKSRDHDIIFLEDVMTQVFSYNPTLLACIIVSGLFIVGATHYSGFVFCLNPLVIIPSGFGLLAMFAGLYTLFASIWNKQKEWKYVRSFEDLAARQKLEKVI